MRDKHSEFGKRLIKRVETIKEYYIKNPPEGVKSMHYKILYLSLQLLNYRLRELAAHYRMTGVLIWWTIFWSEYYSIKFGAPVIDAETRQSISEEERQWLLRSLKKQRRTYTKNKGRVFFV